MVGLVGDGQKIENQQNPSQVELSEEENTRLPHRSARSVGDEIADELGRRSLGKCDHEWIVISGSCIVKVSRRPDDRASGRPFWNDSGSFDYEPAGFAKPLSRAACSQNCESRLPPSHAHQLWARWTKMYACEGCAQE